MLRKTIISPLWSGGAGSQPSLSTTLRHPTDMHINITKEVVRGAVPPEYRKIQGERSKPAAGMSLNLRSDLYDELLKLPLRYKLHPFERLIDVRQGKYSGYGAPLGPVDTLDTIPFHVHRNGKGALYGTCRSMNAKKLMPHFLVRLNLIDGDMNRFEDELIKIFPTKKIFTRDFQVIIHHAGKDALEIVHHWYLGLGF
eukprot:Tbor_TRINITY_DN5674_c0_g2::TRINITY_DN5674_c0_g2_i4::g.9561::m.9561